MSSLLLTLPDGRNLSGDKLLSTWDTRVTQGLAARKPFEAQWIENQAAAAGQQWLRVIERGGRQLIDIRDELRRQGRSTQEADVLSQYLWTAVGKLAADDFRPELLAYHDDAEGDTFTEALNKVFGWGWDEEWKGDAACFDLLLTLGTYGHGAIQPRYDRSRGKFLGQVPHAGPDGHTYTDGNGAEQSVGAGRPILDKGAATAYVADKQQYGENAGLRPLREGAITWPVLTPWNLVVPAGIENDQDFGHQIIFRPVAVDAIQDTYGDRAQTVESEGIEAMNVLGIRDLSASDGGIAGAAPKLEGCALLKTGYERPCGKYPQGMTVIWAGTSLLHVEQGLPFKRGPQGPRDGITHFRYWKVKGRFWGRALVEPGIGPQRTRNKRLSQEDEIIDRATPKVYANEGDIIDPDGHIMEVIALKPGSQPPKIDPGIGPGPWFKDSIQQCDDDIEKGLGLHDSSIGAEAPAGTPYASLALQAENDQTKLGPIADTFKLGIADVSRDTLESMREWPEGKRLMILGDEDHLEQVIYSRSMVPDQYMVKPAKGGGVPRSQGAELQKINDLWTAAETSGVVAQDPVAWMDWYRESLDAGQAQDFPEMDAKQQQQHKAALENVVMVHTGKVVPVAPYDDAQIHIPVHDEQEAKLAQAAMAGDPEADQLAQVIEQHKQMHLQMAAQNAPPGAGQTPPPGPPQGPSQGAPGLLPGQGPPTAPPTIPSSLTPQ